MRQTLKQHTALSHKILDSSPALSSLLKPGLSLSDYFRTLDGYALAHEFLEGDLVRLETTVFLGEVPEYTPRLPALVQDLDELGQRAANPRRALAPDKGRRRMHTEWHYWGARYVLEGATQGSKFIASRLRKHLPQLEPSAFEFWKLQLRLAQEWAVVCEHLSESAPKGDSTLQLLGGADIVFNTYLRCFTSMDIDRENSI